MHRRTEQNEKNNMEKTKRNITFGLLAMTNMANWYLILFHFLSIDDKDVLSPP